jgi:uncharacterized RDD family membrane protein YckC
VSSSFPGGEHVAPAGYRDAVPPGVDPTKALWRRIFAYVIDAALGTLIALAVAGALGDVDTADARRCPDQLPDDRLCVDLTSGTGDDDDEQILLIDTSAVLIAAGAWLVWVVANNVLLQGTTGATVGKFVTGARVVRPDGGRPGIGKALVRTLLLIIDTISLILPLGLWVAMFSRGHRRIGDMAAGTYVVKARYAGRPVVLP